MKAILAWISRGVVPSLNQGGEVSVRIEPGFPALDEAEVAALRADKPRLLEDLSELASRGVAAEDVLYALKTERYAPPWLTVENLPPQALERYHDAYGRMHNFRISHETAHARALDRAWEILRKV